MGLDLIRMSVDGYQVLRSPPVQRGAMILLRCRDQTSSRLGVLRIGLLTCRLPSPFARKGASALHAVEHTLHVGIFEASLEPNSHHAGMKYVLIISELYEIIEDPVLTCAGS